MHTENNSVQHEGAIFLSSFLIAELLKAGNSVRRTKGNRKERHNGRYKKSIVKFH